jgi:hypothetical protein
MSPSGRADIQIIQRAAVTPTVQVQEASTLGSTWSDGTGGRPIFAQTLRFAACQSLRGPSIGVSHADYPRKPLRV